MSSTLPCKNTVLRVAFGALTLPWLLLYAGQTLANDDDSWGSMPNDRSCATPPQVLERVAGRLVGDSEPTGRPTRLQDSSSIAVRSQYRSRDPNWPWHTVHSTGLGIPARAPDIPEGLTARAYTADDIRSYVDERMRPYLENFELAIPQGTTRERAEAFASEYSAREGRRYRVEFAGSGRTNDVFFLVPEGEPVTAATTRIRVYQPQGRATYTDEHGVARTVTDRDRVLAQLRRYFVAEFIVQQYSLAGRPVASLSGLSSRPEDLRRGIQVRSAAHGLEASDLASAIDNIDRSGRTDHIGSSRDSGYRSAREALRDHPERRRRLRRQFDALEYAFSHSRDRVIEYLQESGSDTARNRDLVAEAERNPGGIVFIGRPDTGAYAPIGLDSNHGRNWIADPTADGGTVTIIDE